MRWSRRGWGLRENRRNKPHAKHLPICKVKAKFELDSLRCIDDWRKESPASEFIYDSLSDLVHPNKGSNLAATGRTRRRIRFRYGDRKSGGMVICERIFPDPNAGAVRAFVEAVCVAARQPASPVGIGN